MNDWKDQLTSVWQRLQAVTDAPEGQCEPPAQAAVTQPPQPQPAKAPTVPDQRPKTAVPRTGSVPPTAKSRHRAAQRKRREREIAAANAKFDAAQSKTRATSTNWDVKALAVYDRKPAIEPKTIQVNRGVEFVPVSTQFQPQINATLSMPDWTGIGKNLQHPEAQGGRPLQVRLGIDFGTAFTKVALRVGPDLVVVNWSAVTGDVTPAGRWIVPGLVWRESDGEFGWQQSGNGAWQGNLKLPLTENPASAPFPCPSATLAYLALVIRYARAFLYQYPEISRKLVNRSLRWELNLGCPTQPHENPEIVARFQHMARTAWWLAGCDTLNEAGIHAAWNRRDLDTGLETDPGIVPEFVAQIAGYLQSPQVNEGLHALIDVGAATLDVATFNVVKNRDQPDDPDWRIPIFFSEVKSLGTHFFTHWRHGQLGLAPVWDDAAPVEATNDFAGRHGKSKAAVDAIDVEFIKEVTRCITCVIDATRTNKRGDPRSSAWHEGLPVFVTGGGAACDVYRRALKASEQTITRQVQAYMAAEGLQISRFRFLATPLLATAAQGISSQQAIGRLTVAIGLTEDASNIARIMPHRDTAPVTLPATESIHHEDLYGD